MAVLPPHPPRAPLRSRVLAVDSAELAALAGRLPRRCAAGPVAAIAAAAVATRVPAVAAALFGVSLDLYDLLDALAAAGYRGRVLALAPPLPNRRLVQRELSAQAPALRLRLVTLGALRPAAGP